MKTKTTFTKTAHGLIKALISITDVGDYHTIHIFDENTGELADNFQLAARVTYTMACIFSDATQANDWADKNLDIIEEALTDWRNITIPEDREDEF
jgi:hypothetical protein